MAEEGVGALWDDGQLTELPAAWVVLKETDEILSEEEKQQVLRDVQSVVDGQVSGYKKLRGGVWLVDELPRNATGKILRK